MGEGFYSHGLKKNSSRTIFGLFLYYIYIRTYHSKGQVLSFKTQDLVAFQKSDSKARKLKEGKLRKSRVRLLLRVTIDNHEQQKPVIHF